jgi:glycosyltransferase involved in cell wall biosynthesis
MPYKLGFVMEQTLGQVTHTKNFQQWVARDPSIIPTWFPISYEERRGLAALPLLSRNWTVRASLQARDRVRAALRTQAFDALFFHTQVTALFAHRIMVEVPTIVSMDATPLNFDTIGKPYAHTTSAVKSIESLKNALTRRSFNRARCLVVWHEWGKASLVQDYGAPAEKVSVIPPGVDLDEWNFPRPAPRSSNRVRLLFVGGDFARKGGDTLLAAMRQGLAASCDLDIVTRAPVDTTGLPGVRVHHGLDPNAPALMALYRSADIFVFPTLADVLPLAIMEAMASGLPVITTDVGAIREQIEDGVTGSLIPPNDVDALCRATLRLVENDDLRHSMGAAARRAGERLFNGARNYPRILELMKRCADQANGTRG